MSNWELTTDIMDKAKVYIETNGITIYKKEHTESVDLSLAISKRYGKVTLAGVEAIANSALEQVSELMGWDCSMANFIAKIRESA